MSRVTIKSIKSNKLKKPIVCLTAYSKFIAQILDKYCDIILVGDSTSMVLYGMKTTRDISLETMIQHAKAVKKSTKKSLVVCDMPYSSYSNKLIALKNAKKIIEKTKCDAVKLEGGKDIANIVKFLTQKGIPVMGHIGLMPQQSKKFIIKGKTNSQKKKILSDAVSISNAGAFAIVIECVVESLAKIITNIIPIPTIGIGASRYCDGQILVTDDILGMSNIQPKFIRKYCNVENIIEKGIKKFCKDVRYKKFPSNKNVYNY